MYEEGWQSWSPVGVYGATTTSARPPGRLAHVMGWRAGKELPEQGFQGEGLLAVAAGDEPVRLWYAPDPAREVASLRLQSLEDRLLVSSDGPTVELVVEGTLEHALGDVGAQLAPGPITSIPPGWCSWSCYFGDVTEEAVLENVAAARALSLPIDIWQVDDGHESCVGDWLESAPRFGSLRRTAERVRAEGRVAGVWTAPFLVGERSALAAAHPDWLVEGADAGWNWGQRLRILDVTHPGAAAHLRTTYETLADWGFRHHKLDFLYAGALEGRRHADLTSLEAYREGLRLVREGAGPDAILLGCGAPLLPSIGLVDAMRIGPDVLPEPSGDPPATLAPSLADAVSRTQARRWTHGRLWAADPDSLVARPEVVERERWAAHVAAYGGVAFSGDRLRELDERGLALTRRALRASTTGPVAETPTPR